MNFTDSQLVGIYLSLLIKKYENTEVEEIPHINYPNNYSATSYHDKVIFIWEETWCTGAGTKEPTQTETQTEAKTQTETQKMSMNYLHTI